MWALLVLAVMWSSERSTEQDQNLHQDWLHYTTLGSSPLPALSQPVSQGWLGGWWAQDWRWQVTTTARWDQALSSHSAQHSPAPPPPQLTTRPASAGSLKARWGDFHFKTKQITVSGGNSCNKIVTISQLVKTVRLYLQHIKINPLRASSTCLNLLFSAMFQLDNLGGKIHF